MLPMRPHRELALIDVRLAAMWAREIAHRLPKQPRDIVCRRRIRRDRRLIVAIDDRYFVKRFIDLLRLSSNAARMEVHAGFTLRAGSVHHGRQRAPQRQATWVVSDVDRSTLW